MAACSLDNLNEISNGDMKSSNVNQQVTGHGHQLFGVVKANTLIGCVQIFKENATKSALPEATKENHSDQKNHKILKQKLQELYKESVIPSVNWLNEGEDFIFKEYFVELQQSDSTNKEKEKPMKIEEMFDAVDRRLPTRILIESPPGFGKTTLATKMAFDWANGEPYIQGFDLLFLILLRNLKNKTLMQGIQSITKSVMEPDELGIVDEKKVLVILDGYDEMNSISAQDITRVLYKVHSENMTVVVTSRFGVFPLEKSEVQKLLPEVFHNRRTEFYQKKVVIKGIAEEHRLEFLKKFCPNRSPERIIETLQKWPKEIMLLLRSPLLLFLVSYFHAEESCLSNTSSITDLYKSLMINIMKTNLAKHGTVIPAGFNLFALDEKTSKKYQKTLAEFGRLCLIKLAKGSYRFEITGFTKRIYSLGLLTKVKERHLYSHSSYFDCFHLSIMEFCIAFYQWRSYNANWFRRKFQNANLLCTVLEKSKGTSMIYRFLCDLLDNEARISLIGELKRFGCGLFRESTLWRLVSTLKESNDAVDMIADFVTTPVHSSVYPDIAQFYESEFHANIIAASARKIKHLCVKVSDEVRMNLPNQVVIPVVHAQVWTTDKNVSNDSLLHLNSKCQCMTLYFQLKWTLFTEVDDDVYETHIGYFKSIQAFDKRVLITDFWYKLPYPFLTNMRKLSMRLTKAFEGVCFTELDIRNVVNYPLYTLICVLLKFDQIYSLDCRIIPYPEYFCNIFAGISHCKSLCKFSFTNLGVEFKVDLHELVAEKEWEQLEILNCELYCSLGKNECAKCKKAIEDIGRNGKFCNSTEESVNINCPWRNVKPRTVFQNFCTE